LGDEVLGEVLEEAEVVLVEVYGVVEVGPDGGFYFGEGDGHEGRIRSGEVLLFSQFFLGLK